MTGLTIAQIQKIISGAISKTEQSIKIWMNTVKDDSGTNYVPVVTSDGYQVISGTVTANAGTNLNTSALALETTLGTVHGHVDSIDGKITACNTGAVVVSSGAITETNSSTISTTLTAIKSTDGIKKITDALPTGSNVIGKVYVTNGTDTSIIATSDGADIANTNKCLVVICLNYVWDASNTKWIPMTQP